MSIYVFNFKVRYDFKVHSKALAFFALLYSSK